MSKKDPSDTEPTLPSSDQEKQDLNRLDAIEARLKEISTSQRKEQKAQQKVFVDNAGMAKGLRLAAEFVSGILAGLVFGFIFDHILGTKPWGLIIFLLFGFAAGLLNLYRAASVR